jgi:hypothetical protein
MKTYNKFMLALLGATLVVGTGSAQNWTVNGTPQSTQLTTSANEAAVAIDPATGAATVKTAGAGPSVAISANPSSVNVNAATTISWTASGFGNNLNCTRTSSPALTGWANTSTSATGSVSVTMPATVQTVTLTLSCTGDNGAVSNFTNVAVTDPGTAVNCSQRPPSYNGSPRTLVSRPFFDAWDLPFPGGIGQGTAFLSSGPLVSHGTVLALQFVAPTLDLVPFDGYLSAVYSPEGGGRGSIAAGFSECPGEINNNTQGCEGSSGKTLSNWTLKTTPPDSTYCRLVPGRTYYFNLTVTNAGCVSGPAPGTPGANCAYRLETKRYAN